MVIEYSVCGNCGHKSKDHKGRCLIKGCDCGSFKAKGS